MMPIYNDKINLKVYLYINICKIKNSINTIYKIFLNNKIDKLGSYSIIQL